MKINAVASSSLMSRGTFSGSANTICNSLSSNANDVFVKQNLDINFGGFRKKKNIEPKKEDNLSSSLKNISIKGMPFLLGLATSVAMVKMGDQAEELLCDDDGYLVHQDGVKSDLVDINEKEGIIKFEGTGIEIDADNYDVVDWENGVFKNYDGSVDIDLGNNKFIDATKGIFVDPAARISAVLDGDNFENIAIPTFGSGYPTCPWDDRWSTLQQARASRESNDEQDSILDRATSFIKGLFGENAHSDIEGSEDIFGNKIMAATDNDGDRYLTSRPNIADNPVFKDFIKTTGDEETAVETFNNMRLKSYLEDRYPSFGTRVMVYEGGRHSWGAQMPDIEDRYDSKQVSEVLDKISQDGSYFPDPGSEEAINFAKYQNLMLKEGLWEHPMVSPNLILDTNGDGVPDVDLDGDGIPDYDRNGDGIIDMSSDQDNSILGRIFEAFKNLLD